MNTIIRRIAVVLSAAGILLSLTYLVLLALSYVTVLPFDVQPNVLFSDWVFIAIPIIGLLIGILLQIGALRDRKKKKAR